MDAIMRFAFSLCTPITILSGFVKSLIASPSLINSGFETRAYLIGLFCADAITFPIFSKVPTGAVLLFTIILYPFMYRPIFSATDVMADISAQLLLSEGVPTAIKITSDFWMQSLIFVIKTILFSLAFR